MSLTVREIPFNWRRAVQGVAAFDLSEMRNCGTKPARKLSVFLPSGTVEDLIEVRDWLHDNAISYTLLGRFSSQDFRLRIERSFDGLTFRFCNSVDAVHFTLRWAGCLPRIDRSDGRE